MPIPSYAHKNLTTQGFTCNEAGFEHSSPWLRLNPGICLLIAVLGLIYASSTLFFILAFFGGLGVLLPNSLGDMVYNGIIRHIVGTQKLPLTPAPRRFACFVGLVWGFATGLLFLYGYASVAYVVGTLLVLAVIPMVALHFCIASLIYQAFTHGTTGHS